MQTVALAAVAVAVPPALVVAASFPAVAAAVLTVVTGVYVVGHYASVGEPPDEQDGQATLTVTDREGSVARSD